MGKVNWWVSFSSFVGRVDHIAVSWVVSADFSIVHHSFLGSQYVFASTSTASQRYSQQFESTEEWLRRKGASLDAALYGIDSASEALEEGYKFEEQTSDGKWKLFLSRQLLSEREREEKRRRLEDDLWLAHWGFPTLEEMPIQSGAMEEDRLNGRRKRGDEDDGGRERSDAQHGRREDLEGADMGISSGSDGEPFDEANAAKQSHALLCGIAKGQKKTERKVDGMRKDIKTVQGDVDQIRKRQDVSDEKVENLQKQIDDMKSGSIASGSTTVGSKGFGKGSRAWSASKVEIKGWVIDWKIPDLRTQQMLTAHDGECLIKNAIGCLSAELQTKLDEKASLEIMGSFEDAAGRQNSRSLISKVVLKTTSSADSSQLWEIRKIINQNIALLPNGPLGQNMTAIPGTFSARNLRCVVETPPWQTAHVAKIGQFKEMWKRRNEFEETPAANVPELRGKAGPPVTEILTAVASSQERPISLAEWAEGKGWTLHSGGLQQVVPTLKLVEFKAELEKLA